jgi:hypothetical protein
MTDATAVSRTAGQPTITAGGQGPVDAFRAEVEKEFLATGLQKGMRAAEKKGALNCGPRDRGRSDPKYSHARLLRLTKTSWKYSAPITLTADNSDTRMWVSPTT